MSVITEKEYDEFVQTWKKIRKAFITNTDLDVDYISFINGVIQIRDYDGYGEYSTYEFPEDLLFKEGNLRDIIAEYKYQMAVIKKLKGLKDEDIPTELLFKEGKIDELYKEHQRKKYEEIRKLQEAKNLELKEKRIEEEKKLYWELKEKYGFK